MLVWVFSNAFEKNLTKQEKERENNGNNWGTSSDHIGSRWKF